VLSQLGALRCPTLVVHGDRDVRVHVSAGHRVARATGGELVIMHGSGHLPDARDPVRFNRIVRDFVARLGLVPPCPEERRWTRSVDRSPTVLYLSSAIGLGHARRDLAIVAALREQRPEVRVEWLAQHPVTALLERAGEHVHPASRFLASESSHVERECGEHDLRVFQAYRTMDEVLCCNFQVVQDVVEDGTYDLLVGDEAWETDFYLHENPELKRTGFVWMTDFVGWLPMASGGDREALLTADYNAEMLEQVARLPRVRDRALFVGEAADIVPDTFGPGLPGIREWTQEHFDLVGYISGVPLVPPADRAAVRAELGFGEDERVCVVAVGGTSVGTSLLRRVIAAWPEVHRDVPDLRMLVVTGPRIDPRSLTGTLPDPGHVRHGLDVRAFVPDLWRHLAVCDVAVVQSGLTTTMELVANARPFVHVPLRNHFEQQIHVRHRLARYRAGHCMDYDDVRAETLVPALRRLLDEPVTSLPVRSGGARTAATALSQLL
jgi:pimeloyl-ACP methyl ester carboxylesterase